MPEIAIVFALVGVVFLAILLIRTYSFKSKQIQVDPVSDIVVNTEEPVKHLSRAIQFRTISYEDSTQFDSKEFFGLHTYLQQAFPKIHSTLTKEVVGEYSLLYTWKGRDSQLKPLLLMAHIDVVPVEVGTEADWTYQPFEGRIAKGYIWGRGTLDDKVSVLGILEAVEILLREGFKPKRTVYLAFGHDEEVGGQDGAVVIATHLRSKGIELEYVLDEGGFITDGIQLGVSVPVALVGIADKGYVSVELTVRSKGGHSSMPPQHTAIGILSTATHKLEKNQFRGRIEGPVRKMFEYVGPEMPFIKRMMFANLWLFGSLIKRKLTASSVTNALIRTTTAPTIVRGGVKENVLPIQARATVNFRIHPSDSIDSVMNHVRKTINDTRVKIASLESSLTFEPSKKSSVDSTSFEILQRTIRQIFPKVLIAPYLVVGATDSRHYGKVSENVFRFTPLWLDAKKTKMVHGTNERLSIENYERCIKFYIQLIHNSAL